MRNKIKILIIILIILLLILPVFCIKTIKEINKENTTLANAKDIISVDEEDVTNYSRSYQQWLTLSDEEKAKIGVIPDQYDVPMDAVYERMTQKNMENKIASTANKEELPTSFILIGEDTNKDGMTDDNDIKVDSYGGINMMVENQANSSLCWAFASLNCLESNLALNYNVEYDFSERHLDYLQSDLFRENTYRNQNAGGSFSINFKNYVKLDDGPVLETEVPLDSQYTTILDYEYLEGLFQRVKANEEDLVYMPTINKETTSYTEEELNIFRTLVKEHIVKNGSLEASIYSGAIEKSVDGENQVLNYQSDHIADHSISIIGWDDNFSKDNFPQSCRPNNNGAYIALNSWGAEWGNCGIFYISYDDILVEESMHGVANAYVLDVLDIYVETEPNNVSYTVGETFDRNGMIVKAQYQNGEEKEIVDYAISPEIISDNTEYITISYTEGNSTQTTIQKINVYNSKESIGTGIKLYYDSDNKSMFVFGTGILTSNLAGYNLEKIILDEGIKGVSLNSINNLTQLNRIYILDKECVISGNLLTNENMTVYCYVDSVAQEYCEENNIIYFAYDNYYQCGKNAYGFLNKTNKRLVISGVAGIYEYKLNEIPWKNENEYIDNIEIDNGITNVSDKLFAENSNIQTVKMGENVNQIGDYSFYNCTNLSQIELNDSLQSIGKCAFYNCTSVPEINIPDNVKKIGEYCFYNCINLVDVNLPSKITRIDDYVFYNCVLLKEIELPDRINYLGSRAFMNCASLERIKMPNKIYSINNFTFAKCTSLKEVDFANSKPGHLGDAAFSGCTSIETFIMPDTITSMGTSLIGCTSLKTLEFSHGLTRIWNAVAQNCTSLEEVSIPYGVKIIGERNFLGGTNLKKVTLPCGLETIGSNNFSSCNNLQYVIVPSSVILDESTNLLGGCKSNPTIYCKSNSSIMEYAINNSINYKIDDTKPNLEVIQEKLNNGRRKICIIASDDNNIVGLSDYPYSFDGGETWQLEPYMEISENTIITVCVRDAVGNIVSQEIEAEEVQISEIEIKTLPKTTYVKGEELDITKGVITVRYEDESETDIEMTNSEVTVTGYDKTKLGEQTLTITYKEKTVTFSVTVKNEVVSIEVKTLPKTTYVKGEELNIANGVITATYEDDSTEDIEMTNSEVTVTGHDKSQLGEQILTITYKGKKVEYNIVVIDKLEIDFGEYEIDEKIYIQNIMPNTTKEEFLKNIKTNGDIKIYKGITEVTDSTSKIATGMIVKISLNNEQVEYTVIVTGDINGDGSIKASDLSVLKANIIGREELTGAYLKAADTNGDGKIKASDLSILKSILVSK